jgi:hypothetical protein
MLLLTIPRRLKLWLVGIVSGTLAVAIAFGLGFYRGRTEVEDLKKQQETALANMRAGESKVAKLEARRRLHLAIVAVDDRNFGIAQRELEEAAKALAASHPAAGSEIEKLKTQLSSAKLVATEDLGVQRLRILAWANALDKQL